MDEPRKIDLKCWLAETTIIVLVLVALRKGNPYGYYIFFRWAVCPLFAWIAWKSYSKGTIALAVAAGLMAVITNPVLRVMMSRDKWEIVNILMIAVAIWSVVLHSIRCTKGP